MNKLSIWKQFHNCTSTERLIMGLLILGLLGTLTAGLFLDVTRDAAKYAYISKEMIETGNWINLQIVGEPYEQKPHLVFWLSSLSFLAFGVSNLSFKLPMLLASLAGVYFVFRFGKVIYNEKIGLLAAFMSCFSVLFILYNQDIHTDTLLFFISSLNLWTLSSYLKYRKIKQLLIAALGLGLGLLTKGPFGVLIPFIFVIVYQIHSRNRRFLKEKQWYLMVILALIFATPIFYHLYYNWGTDGLVFFFFGNTFGRFTGSYTSNIQDPSFYLHNLLYLFLPWSLMLFAALYTHVKKLTTHKTEVFQAATILTVLFFILSLSLAATKMPNYLLTSLPLIALLTASAWEEKFVTNKSFARMQYGVGMFLMALALALLFFTEGNRLPRLIFIVALIAVFTLLTRKTKSKYSPLVFSALSLVCVSLVLNLWLLPHLYKHQAQPKAAKTFNNRFSETHQLYNYTKKDLDASIETRKKVNQNDTTEMRPVMRHFSYNYELMFYAKQLPIQITNDENLKEVIKPPAAVYTDRAGLLEIKRQALAVDTLFSYDHFSLDNTAKLINPGNKKPILEEHYLVVIEL